MLVEVGAVGAASVAAASAAEEAVFDSSLAARRAQRWRFHYHALQRQMQKPTKALANSKRRHQTDP